MRPNHNHWISKRHLMQYLHNVCVVVLPRGRVLNAFYMVRLMWKLLLLLLLLLLLRLRCSLQNQAHFGGRSDSFDALMFGGGVQGKWAEPSLIENARAGYPRRRWVGCTRGPTLPFEKRAKQPGQTETFESARKNSVANGHTMLV